MAEAGGHLFSDLAFAAFGARQTFAGMAHADKLFKNGVAFSAAKFVNRHWFILLRNRLPAGHSHTQSPR